MASVCTSSSLYRVKWLAGDAVAGCTLAAYAIPVSLAYAGLAGLPPQAGIYGYLLGGLGYALLGSSRHRTDLCDFLNDRRYRRDDGLRRCAALRPDRQPRGLHSGPALPDRMATAAERAGAADQRQHPGGIQGRRRIDDRNDPDAKPDRPCGRRTQFL
jgi:Sulfate permease family